MKEKITLSKSSLDTHNTDIFYTGPQLKSFVVIDWV